MPLVEDSIEKTYSSMKEKLHNVVPDFELRYKAELVYEINRRKKERGAVILGHNYMEPALYHTVPDFVGDSLELARKAAETTCDPIIFCGVRFMAETAKILNPGRTVLLPAREAGCSLAASITAQDVRDLRAKYPGVPIVTYINTYADVKAECDVCCTSGNAAKIVQSLDSDTVIFIPDEYLARNVAKETGKKIILPSESMQAEPTIIGWTGKCEVHEQFSPSDIKNVREQFPEVVVLAHPECSPEVTEASDFTGSTSKMIQYVREKQAPHFLLLTECSMADNIMAENPGKEMLQLCSVRCPHMNQITLEDTLNSLVNNEYIIELPEKVIKKARVSLDRMLELSN
ncbi:MAG: quinolinate synthase NadA [Deltaproteobacteria bacterium]|nr:quinolinate synthase NadA [Deltaproteobacteria bacterium]